MIKAQARKNIRWVTEVVPQELLGDKNLTGIRVLNPGTGEIREILIDAVFVAIGQIPENDAFAEIVDTDSSGYLIAGEDCATNVPGIYAAGDCRTKSVRQLTTAAADGAIAAIAAWEYISDF
jgi:thioredoxin reductase (NADPH)